MKRSFMYRTIGIVAVLTVFLWALASAAESPDKAKNGKDAGLAKGAAGLSWQVLNINNIWTWHRSDGEGNHSPGGEDGVSYPIFTGRCVYEDNMVFGGIVYNNGFPGTGTKAAAQPVRINGGSYLSHHGMVNGWVNGLGASAVGVNPDDPLARIYRIRRDYKEMSETEKTKDAAISYEQLNVGTVTQSMIDAVIAQYEKDWTEWPVQYGAPYIERNGVPGYQAPPAFQDDGSFTVDSLIAGNYDEPGVAGNDNTTPADQVLYTMYHGLDRAKTTFFEGSEPIGIAVQKTVWGYKRTDALGNVYFTRYRLINAGGIDIGGGTKGSFYVDSMFLCQWSDIDLGNAGDDLVGSDSVLSMGYVYNGNAVDISYQRFNLPPPSSGYDFLGGPLVPAVGDSGIYGLKRVYDVRNLGMSAFSFFSAGSPFTDPPFETYSTGTGRWWNLLRGYAPLGTIDDAPSPFPHPLGAAITRFPYSGDPSKPPAVDNFLDGLGTTYSFAPGDRRILLNTGPFRMAPGDTQDIYMGFVVGIGGDRISSVAVMKAYDKACQETFDLVFQVAKPPKNPNVKVTELDGEILLDWSFDQATIADTENKVVIPGNYTFEGYNLYQFPSAGASLSDAVRIGTYDVVNGVTTVSDQVFDAVIGQFVLKPVQLGSDAGVKRFVSIKTDYSRDIPKLYNGQEYYFAVTGYSRATLAGYTAALESAPNVLTVRPKVPFGKQLTSTTGDTVTVTRASGISDGSVEAYIADPLSVTGDTYEVRFQAAPMWGVFNVTKNVWAAQGLTNQSGDANYPVVDGLTVKAVGPPATYKDFLALANSAGPINPPGYAAFGFDGDYPDPRGASPGGGPTPASPAGGLWGFALSDADRSFSRFIARSTQYSGGLGEADQGLQALLPDDYEWRFTAGGGMALSAFGTATNATMMTVPYEIWNTQGNSDPSDDFRIFNLVLDNGNGVFDLNAVDNVVSGAANDPQTDLMYLVQPLDETPGQAGYNALVAQVTADPVAAEAATLWAYKDATYNTKPALMRLTLVNWNGGTVTDPTFPANVNEVMPATGTILQIALTKPNTTADVFSYNTTAFAPVQGAELAKASANKVGVYPNPYYTQNAAEVDRFERYVTFNNLPQKATIRVFNLAGHLVRTLVKSDNTQFARWDLANEKNFPVSSGIYICHIDMPDVGVTKVVKLAVIMEQEVLDIF